MLKGISNLITPELLKILCEMGHGDEICIGDSNFPADSVAAANGKKIVRLDGVDSVALLDAILQLFPLDTFVDHPVKLMQTVPGFKGECPIWDEYAKVIAKFDARAKGCFQFIERFEYYEHAKNCYAVVASNQSALYANLILKKGIIEKA